MLSVQFKVWYDRSHKNKKSLQDSLGDIIASGTEAKSSQEGRYFFPMHKSYTPRCQQIANSKSFELFIDISVFLNIVVMAMASEDAGQLFERIQLIANVMFVLIYTAELLIKIGARGVRPYLSSKLNKLDVVIVIVSYVALAYNEDADAANSQALRSIQLLRVLRIAKIVQRGVRHLQWVVPHRRVVQQPPANRVLLERSIQQVLLQLRRVNAACVLLVHPPLVVLRVAPIRVTFVVPVNFNRVLLLVRVVTASKEPTWRHRVLLL